MRLAAFLVVLGLAACASEKFALTPPPDVDFSGRWQLNEADSDDPARLAQGDQPGPATGPQGAGGSRRGSRGGAGGSAIPSMAMQPPATPSVGALGEGLRWPGKELRIKQLAGVVTMASGGRTQVYQPTGAATKSSPPHRSHDDRRPDDEGREGPPPTCGWQDRTLVVQSGDADDDHPLSEQRFSLSQDGKRLIEVVGFQGGRSGGYTMSRAWDRAQ
jgi:hypothetical protein